MTNLEELACQYVVVGLQGARAYSLGVGLQHILLDPTYYWHKASPPNFGSI